MYTRGDARQLHVGLLILLLSCTSYAAEGRHYKAKERQSSDSGEQSSDEGAVPFSAEFGEFFPDGSPKESGESFGFSGDFNPDFIPYSESRNVTRYVNPAETYHSVRDMPGHGRDQSRSYKEEHGHSRKYEPSNRKEYRKDHRKHSSHPKDEPYPKDDNYRKEEGYSKDGGYHKDDSYRKSSSYRKDESYRRKDEPDYRSHDSPYRSKDGSSSYSRREDTSYSKEDESMPYRSRSDPKYRKDGAPRSSSKSDSSSTRSSGKENSESPDRGYKGKKPIQNLYDDWSPEDDKPSYVDKDRSEPDRDSEYDEPDYRERDDAPPPPPPPPSSSRYSDKESRKSLPTSMRPGPPYYNPPIRRPEPRTHTTSFGVRHELPPPPTPQTYYAPSTSQRKHDHSREFHHRKGEPASPKQQREWSEFRPSPPDPLQNSRARSRSDDFPQTEYSSPVPKKEKALTTTPRPHRQNCVKMKKTSSPDTNNGKYVKKMTTCYVCVDEKTGTNYEECSYESDSKTRPFVKTTGEEQSRRADVSHRDKRDLSKVVNADSALPKELTERLKREKDYYDSSKEEGDGYKFNPDASFDEEDREKEETSQESPDSSAENCYKKRKGEMSCVVCESPNKKGSFEQCSYASDPNKNKYEHSVEKVYGSPRLPKSSVKYGKKGFNSKDEDYDTSVELPTKSDYGSSAEYDPSTNDNGKNKAERKQFGGGSDSFGFGSFGDGFGSLFGDLSGEAFDFDSIPEPAENEGQFSTKDEIFKFKPDEIGDIDMTKNIGDFGQKNRSHCKKVMKNKMTCYQCVTSKGTKNEECMYVAAAEPKSKHLSFSQVHEYRFDPENSTAEPSVDYPSFNFGKRKNKKYHPDLTDMKFFNKLKEKATMQASRWPRSPDVQNGTLNETMDSRNATTKDDQAVSATETNARQAEAEEEQEENEEGGENEEDSGEEEEEDEDEEEEDPPYEQYNAVPTDPPELDLKEAEKGEFHSETESAWDPKLGISLPRYMLERSEHEAIFDEVLASG